MVKNAVNWTSVFWSDKTVQDLDWSFSPGALQSAQISVKARNFGLDVISFYIKTHVLRWSCRLSLFKIVFYSQQHPLQNIWFPKSLGPVVFWSAKEQLDMRSGPTTVILSGLTGRTAAGNAFIIKQTKTGPKYFEICFENTSIASDSYKYSTRKPSLLVYVSR